MKRYGLSLKKYKQLSLVILLMYLIKKYLSRRNGLRRSTGICNSIQQIFINLL